MRPTAGVAPSGMAMRDASPRISVVIPTFQRRRIVMATVQSLARQETTSTFEVIVVVDGSTDGTAEALRSADFPFQLTVIEQRNTGASGARNAGARRARGDLILFLDDDMEADSRLLAEHASSHQQGAEVVLGHFALHPQSPRNILSALVEEWVDGRLERLTKVQERELTQEHLYDFHAAQMSLRRGAFEQVGGFSDSLTSRGAFGNEDYDFGYRLALAGYRAVFNPRAVTYQNYVVGPRDYLGRARQAGRADVTFVRRHPEHRESLFHARGAWTATSRFLWRPAASRAWLAAPLSGVLWCLALAAFSLGTGQGRLSRWLRWFFFAAGRLEYWRGVRDGGGIPHKHSVRVLCYGRIVSADGACSAPRRGVPADQFREHMVLLSRMGYHFIGLKELLSLVRREGKVPSNPVLVTLDGGLASARLVTTVLHDLGIPAVAFIDEREWNDAGDGGTGGSNVIEACRRTMADGVEVGWRAGGCDGGDGSTALARAVRESAALPPIAFAYVSGAYDPSVRATAGSEGRQIGFTRTAGLVRAGDDPFRLPRIEIDCSDQGRRFLRKVRLS